MLAEVGVVWKVDSPGEDGGIDDVDVLSAVDLSVSIDDGSAAIQAAVSSDLGGTDPVVGTTGSSGKRQALDIGLDGDVGGGDLEDDLGELGEGSLHVLDGLDDSVKILLGLEIGGL